MQTTKSRNYAAEYARRIANAIARGLSRSQARGHAKATETPSRGPPRPIEDDRLQIALLSGKEHPLETRHNVLYRLASAGEHTFEQVYRIVV